MQLFDECFLKVKTDCFRFISSQETKNEKFKNKDRMIRDQIRKSKRTYQDNKKTLTALKKEIDLNEKDLNKKEDRRLENVEIVRYVKETIEMIQDLDHHTMLLKELRPQKKLNTEELKEVTQKMGHLNGLIESCDHDYGDLEIQNTELNHSFEK